MSGGLVFRIGGSAGGGSDLAPRSNDSIEKITECHEVVLRHGYSGSHNFLERHQVIEQVVCNRPAMREGQSGETAVGDDMKPSVAQGFWNPFGVNYDWLLGLWRPMRR